MASEDIPPKLEAREADEMEKQDSSDETILEDKHLARKLLWKLDTR
jgi:hypothetical protein